ncbi:MAG: AI-2E family transporter [Pseudorhodobacter sp.]
MALPVRQQVLYWSIAALVFFLLLGALGNVLTPFLVGGAIAYFLDPVADRLERWKFSRTMATVIISLCALVIAVLLMLAVLPALSHQLSQLVNTAPEMVRRLQAFITERVPDLLEPDSPIRQALNSFGDTIKEQGAELVQTLFSSAMGVINALVFMVVVPVVTFYMLLDWDRMIAQVDALLPRDHAPTIRRLARQIDATLASFLRGQFLVCLILGVFYSVMLIIAGLQFGLIVGVIAGTITFIPYIGALVGGGLAIGLALFQFWGDWLHILLIAGIFFFGQFLEGNVITPRLVGDSVGLHPVWLLFALSAFGAAFGFVGMLVAVPVAASLGVLTRFVIQKYHRSLLYLGVSPPPPPDPDEEDDDPPGKEGATT